MPIPKISVIIPIYNTEKYLSKCLDSVVNQTFRDFEIICVDDCSPDDSYKIVQEFQEKDPRVKFILHEKNLGQGGARNTAIKAATAEFIASVDSDDEMQSNMLEVLWNESNHGEYDIVCCGYIRVNDKDEELASTTFSARRIDKNDLSEDNIFKLINPAIWNKIWRKSLFTDNEIYFPNWLYYQDMATIPRLVAKAEKIKFIEPCLYRYLVREGSVTTSYSSKHLIDYFKVYEILYDFLVKNDLDNQMKNLVLFVNEGMRFHGTNVTESNRGDDQINQYLRHFLMLKIGFLEMHNSLASKGEDELVRLLSTATSIDDVVEPSSNILGSVNPLRRELNFLQKSGCLLFGFVFRFSLTDSQFIKLKVDPISFFKDSKNKYSRLIGKTLRLI